MEMVKDWGIWHRPIEMCCLIYWKMHMALWFHTWELEILVKIWVIIESLMYRVHIICLYFYETL